MTVTATRTIYIEVPRHWKARAECQSVMSDDVVLRFKDDLDYGSVVLTREQAEQINRDISAQWGSPSRNCPHCGKSL